MKVLGYEVMMNYTEARQPGALHSVQKVVVKIPSSAFNKCKLQGKQSLQPEVIEEQGQVFIYADEVRPLNAYGDR